MSIYSASRRVNNPDHLLDERLGVTVEVLYPGYCGPPVMAQTNLDMALFPPMTNGWGIKYHVPDMVPPLLAKGEGSPT
jgi:hypothetical protein